MTSTVVDVGLCLLLISAAAVTVASVPEAGMPEDRADEVATTIATTTATVNYSLRRPPGERSGATGRPGERASGPSAVDLERTAHGSLATLLARATVGTVRVHGAPPTRTAAGFAAAVRAATLAVLPPRTRVVVRWRPYPGAHLGRTFVVGPEPPPYVTVHAATVSVPSGVPGANQEVTSAAARGFDPLANRLAARIVAGLFPARQLGHALAGDYPGNALAENRYRQWADAYGVVLGDTLERGDVDAANRRLAEGLSEQVERDLADRYDSPTAATARLRLGSVRIVVRTWSA